VQTRTYSDPNDPYAPSTVADGCGRTTNASWDRYGHPLSITSPRGTVTNITSDYGVFPLGRILSARTGSKAPSTIAYYEPSGLPMTASEPRPGESGTGNTVATSLAWDQLGNVTSVSRPGNNAAATITTTLGYTSDGAYTQPAAVHQPITITNNLGKVRHLRYDARANVTAAWDALGLRVDAAYNLADQPTSILY